MIDDLHSRSLQNRKIIDHFRKILRIPRPSGKETAIRKHILDIVEENHLAWRKDRVGNIAIDLPATAGYETRPRILLQTHMDMVCSGGNDVRPTEAYVDTDGWMKAKGTTLGADNGIGLAMMLALAEETNWVHGPVTLLVTVEEERNLSGVQELEDRILPKDTKIVINLDAEEGAEYICNGSAGGQKIIIQFQAGKKVPLPPDHEVLRLRICGLRGGHSGIDIHKHHGNAILLLNELLPEAGDLYLAKYSGGTVSNALPREAEGVFALEKPKVPEFINFVQNFYTKIRKNGFQKLQLATKNSANLEIHCNIDTSHASSVFPKSMSHNILHCIRDLPNGVLRTISQDPEKVLLSSNLGTIATDGSAVTMKLFPRGASREELIQLSKLISSKAKQYGGVVEKSTLFSPWEEKPDSPAVRLALRAYEKHFSGKPMVFSYHAGLECSVILEKLCAKGCTDISAVAIGPNIKHPHGPEEMVEMKSIDEVYAVLKGMVEQ